MRYCLITTLLLIHTIALAQINTKFIQHLQLNNLRNEHLYYLNNIAPTTANADSLHYQLAKINILLGNDSLFKKHYTMGKTLFNNDTNAFKFTTHYFLNSNNASVSQWWFSNTNFNITDSISALLHSFYISLNTNIPTPALGNQSILFDVKKYNKLKHKSPLIAGTLSAIVPGLGKWYGQRPNSALVTLFTQAL
jgi:hypothetical protein